MKLSGDNRETFEDRLVREGRMQRQDYVKHGTDNREAFVDKLIDEGRLLATQRHLAVALLNYLDLHDGTIMGGDGKINSPLRSLELLLSSGQIAGPDERLAALADERAKEEGVSYSEAFRQIREENPALERECAAFYLAPLGSRRESKSASATIISLAQARSESDGVAFSEALVKVTRDNPLLARQIAEEYMIRPTRSEHGQ